jgi:hypothetical protein
LTFLRNHREAIAAMDFFTVPTLTFGVLYGFFVIAHDRRRILHCNVTRSPEAIWVALRLRQTWERRARSRNASCSSTAIPSLVAMSLRR